MLTPAPPNYVCMRSHVDRSIDGSITCTPQEMAPDKIVSEAAYVLFYRRRRLTPSNVINMTI